MVLNQEGDSEAQIGNVFGESLSETFVDKTKRNFKKNGEE